MNVNVMMQYVTYGLALIGVLAFLVSIIVQVIKELPGLNKIPTSIVAPVSYTHLDVYKRQDEIYGIFNLQGWYPSL